MVLTFLACLALAVLIVGGIKVSIRINRNQLLKSKVATTAAVANGDTYVLKIVVSYKESEKPEPTAVALPEKKALRNEIARELEHVFSALEVDPAQNLPFIKTKLAEALTPLMARYGHVYLSTEFLALIPDEFEVPLPVIPDAGSVLAPESNQ